jgi:outer membrane protein assembly factor BamB
LNLATGFRFRHFSPVLPPAPLRVVLFSLLLLCASRVSAAEWPQFRGPNGDGLCPERNLPLTWNVKTSEGIAWRAELPKSDNAWSSPIVVGGRVFVTCAQNEPLAHQVLCFDARDGRRLWTAEVQPGPWVLRDLRGGYGAPTPCSDGKRVIAVFGSAVIAALDMDGKPLWRRELQRFAFDVALGASPVLSGENVILDCDQTGKTSSIIAFDRATGDIRWEVDRPDTGFSHCTPVVATVAGQPQLLVAASKQLQGLDPATGKLLWWCTASGDAASPSFDGRLVYSDSGRGGKGVCVDPTGRGDVTATHLRWFYPQIPEGLGSAVMAGGFVWRGHGGETIKALRVADGSLAFSEKLPKLSAWASPFATPDGRVYFACAGRTYVLKAGEPLEILATNDLDEEVRASAAVANGHIFVRGRATLFCLGPK